jgi:hypothetical protein
MAVYRGRQVKLNKPFRTPSGSKKSAVYVKNQKTGKVNKVTFGDPNMKIKKSQPARKKSYCARSGGIKTTGQKTLTANYWSRKAWGC